ncbi:MAG: thioredoxin fold domain-containing protein [Gammaproteobacteria bacterium]|jgi:thiol:disulfide interchange protein DsbG
MLKHPQILLATILFVLGLSALPAVQAGSLSTSRTIAGHLLDSIDQATWVAEGKGKHIVYIFFDPDCPYCHKLYNELRPLVAERDLQLRWIPVGMLAATSLGKAAAILQAADPLAALHTNEDNFNFSDGGPGGGIAPAATISEQTRLNLAANLSPLQEQNLFAVPVAVFRARDGRGFMFQGAPPDKTLSQLLQYVQ